MAVGSEAPVLRQRDDLVGDSRAQFARKAGRPGGDVAEQPSPLALAAIQMAQHVLEARRARQAAERGDRRRRLVVVKRDETEAA